jgi:hypothetical protein
LSTYKDIITLRKEGDTMWSDTLQEQTREHFKTMPFAAMKQIGGKFGMGVFRDGKYIITDIETKEIYEFLSMDELIVAKWAID